MSAQERKMLNCLWCLIIFQSSCLKKYIKGDSLTCLLYLIKCLKNNCLKWWTCKRQLNMFLFKKKTAMRRLFKRYLGIAFWDDNWWIALFCSFFARKIFIHYLDLSMHFSHISKMVGFLYYFQNANQTQRENRHFDQVLNSSNKCF